MNPIYLTINIGIGSGIIAKSIFCMGARGLAGEVGHETLAAEGRRCQCGHIVCLEVLASGSTITRNAREALKTGHSSKLGDLGKLIACGVTDAARQVDALALESLERARFYIGLGRVNPLHHCDTQLFVLGGGVALNAWELLYPPKFAILNKHARPAQREGMRIVQAELGDDSGLKGAVAFGGERSIANWNAR